MARPGASEKTPATRATGAARTGVAVVFALNGVALASWFARIPATRDALQLSPGRLGLLLLCVSAGSVLALTTAGLATHRLGTARAVAAATVLASGGLAFVGLASAWRTAFAVGTGLFLLGYGAAMCDVAMNVQAAAVERRLGRSIMPRFHAAWSLGTVAGAIAGAVAARLGVPVLWHLGMAALVTMVGILGAVRWFLPDPAVAPPDPAVAPPDPAVARRGHRSGGSGVLRAWREPRTVLIGLLVLVMAFTEGTANDWLPVAFVDGYRFSEADGAAVFGVFVAAMTAGRTAGTVALDRWGRAPVLFGTVGLATLGALAAVLAPAAPLALFGVLLWGLGASLGFPVGMSAAADDPARAPARVGVVAAIGYTAFLAGPPVVGFLGDRVGTLRALLVVPVVLVAALALVPATRPLPAVAVAGPPRPRAGSTLASGGEPLPAAAVPRGDASRSPGGTVGSRPRPDSPGPPDGATGAAAEPRPGRRTTARPRPNLLSAGAAPRTPERDGGDDGGHCP